MIVEPKVRGFICTTAHPAGCRENVRQQIAYVKSQPGTQGPSRVLVLGSSTGYGLSSRIAAAFGCGAATLGVMYEKPSVKNRTASAGWYNTAAFEQFAQEAGLYAKTINGDAFSREIKEQVIETIRRDWGTVDCVIYSLAAPRRTAPDGVTYNSVLKTTGSDYTNKTIDLKTRTVFQVTIGPATQQEIDDTVRVMGGEDWMDWMKALSDAGVLAQKVITCAYSYLGPQLTHPVYLNGSIGMAKRHLHRTAQEITQAFPQVSAYISVNKALVTQSSAAIPIVPLYISILYRVMKEKNLHEGCIQQMYRLFHDRLFAEPVPVDGEGRIRLDDWEMREDVQVEVAGIWETISTQTVQDAADIDGYWEDFYQMFGFSVPGVDYSAQVDPVVPVPSIEE